MMLLCSFRLNSRADNFPTHLFLTNCNPIRKIPAMYNSSDSQYSYWNVKFAPNFPSRIICQKKKKQVGYHGLQSCFSPAAATQLIILLDVMQQINCMPLCLWQAGCRLFSRAFKHLKKVNIWIIKEVNQRSQGEHEIVWLLWWLLKVWYFCVCILYIINTLKYFQWSFTHTHTHIHTVIVILLHCRRNLCCTDSKRDTVTPQ